MNVLSWKTTPIERPVCKQTVMEGYEVPVVTHHGCSTIQEMVCSYACAQEFRMKNLREKGL